MSIKSQTGGWKPKHKWIKSFRIDLKTGKTKYEYFVPKTLQEEERLESGLDRVYDILFDKVLKTRDKK